jgi:cobalt-zinc-cadmium efflux system membrane fusion protein
VHLNAEQLSNVKIKTVHLQEKNVASVLKINGKIEVPPQNIISISTAIGGYLQSTDLLPGMHISKGAVIAQLQDQEYIQMQEDYLITQSNLALADQEYNRLKDLNASKASSDKSLSRAQTELTMLRIKLSSLTEKLRLININPDKLGPTTIQRSIQMLSPIDGYVSKVNVNIGKYVTPTDVLFELINPSDIHLNLKVYEKDVANLSIGQKVRAYSNVNPKRKYNCEVILISKDISEEGTADVHCHFESFDKSLFPGMYMNAEVQVDEHVTMAVPEESVMNFEGATYLFHALNHDSFELIPVSIGMSENGFVEVKNPEKFMDKAIVKEGAYTLLMKLKNKEE